MLWVAGIPANAADIPTTGSATYTGHAIADISNNASPVYRGGNLQQQRQFRHAEPGQVQIARPRQRAIINGVVNLTPNTAYFAGLLERRGRAAATAALNGQFFQGGPDEHDPSLWRNGRNHPHLGAEQLSRQRHFRRAQALKALTFELRPRLR